MDFVVSNVDAAAYLARELVQAHRSFSFDSVGGGTQVFTVSADDVSLTEALIREHHIPLQCD